MAGRAWPMRSDVFGIELDAETRCAHWHSPLDIVAIRMKCCDRYFACKDCHDALASHAIERWPPSEWQARAIMCGACGTELTIQSYLDGNDACPNCRAAFNPGCRRHRRFYFEVEPGGASSE